MHREVTSRSLQHKSNNNAFEAAISCFCTSCCSHFCAIHRLASAHACAAVIDPRYALALTSTPRRCLRGTERRALRSCAAGRRISGDMHLQANWAAAHNSEARPTGSFTSLRMHARWATVCLCFRTGRPLGHPSRDGMRRPARRTGRQGRWAQYTPTTHARDKYSPAHTTGSRPPVRRLTTLAPAYPDQHQVLLGNTPSRFPCSSSWSDECPTTIRTLNLVISSLIKTK